MLAKKTVKGQITLPKRIVKSFEGVDYFDVTAGEGKIILTPVDIRPSLLSQVREKMRCLGISERDIEDAVKWARKNKQPRE